MYIPAHHNLNEKPDQGTLESRQKPHECVYTCMLSIDISPFFYGKHMQRAKSQKDFIVGNFLHHCLKIPVASNRITTNSRKQFHPMSPDNKGASLC